MDHYTEEEVAVIKQLQRFEPRPGLRAYQTMATAPWTKPPGKTHVISALVHSPFVQRAAAAVLITVIASTVVLVTPPLRLRAQEVLEVLFARAGSNTIAVENQAVPTLAGTIPPSVAQTFYSIEAAERALGNTIRTPQIDLTPYTLSGVTVNHETQTVWLVYNAPDRYLSIYQRSAELGWLDSALVGANALVKTVEFETLSGTAVQGEYVQGGWRPDSEQTASWTPETTQRRLRWQDGQLVYEMVMFGDDLASEDDLVAIASSLP